MCGVPGLQRVTFKKWQLFVTLLLLNTNHIIAMKIRQVLKRTRKVHVSSDQTDNNIYIET